MYKNHTLKKLILILSLKALFCISYAQECNLGHTSTGTAYGEEGVQKYASIKHGPDGQMFLDPYFLPYLSNLENIQILDAGCGAAPFAIYAAMQGAFVTGIDIQADMIKKGKEAVAEAQLEDRITLHVGDVGNLPYKDNSFDKAISINVGCNLPSTEHIEGSPSNIGLGAHFSELARVLNAQGTAIITAPASLYIVFGPGWREQDEVSKDIQHTLNKIDIKDPHSIIEHLNTLNDVYRATFIINNGKLKLITNIDDLIDGQEIWRKLPGMAVPNIYHSENEYITEAMKAGFNIVKIIKPKFNSETEFIEYNEKMPLELKLNNEYLNHNAFIIMILEKQHDQSQ